MKLPRTSALTILVATAVGIAGFGPAQASDPDTPAETIAEQIAAVTPGVSGKSTDISSTTSTGSVIPTDPEQPVRISNPGIDGHDLTVKLPELEGTDTASQAPDGTVVYTSDANASLAVQNLNDGATRFLAVLDSPDAPIRYDYQFEDAELQLEQDGSATALIADQIVGTIDAPWAYDANGVKVPTRYEVHADTLIQVVDHRKIDYAYPIIADPKISFGWGTYFHFNRAETKTLAQYGVGGTSALVTGCAALGAMAAGVGAVIAGTVCAVYGGAFFFQAGVAQNSNPKRCVYLRVIGPVWTPGTYKDARCK